MPENNRQKSRCDHPDFKHAVFINRTVDEASGALNALTADLVIVCKACGQRFYPQSLNEFAHIVLISPE